MVEFGRCCAMRPAHRKPLPWVSGAAVAVKLLVAALALRVGHRRGEMRLSVTGLLLGAWLLVTAILFGVLVCLIAVAVNGAVVPRTLTDK